MTTTTPKKTTTAKATTIPHSAIIWVSPSAGVAMMTIACASREAAEAAGQVAVNAMTGRLLGTSRYAIVAAA